MTACLFNFNRDRVFATCFRILIIPVVIADPFTNQPREEYFPTSCGKKCDNLIILDFGACGSVVRLTPELRAKKTLSIRIASLDKVGMVKILLFSDPFLYEQEDVDLQNYKTFAIILYTEKAYIQWLVLFPELQMIWNWDYRRGHHEAFDLWHSLKHAERQDQLLNQSINETWYLSLIGVRDWTIFPIVGEDPPLRLDVSRPMGNNEIHIIETTMYKIVRLPTGNK